MATLGPNGNSEAKTGTPMEEAISGPDITAMVRVLNSAQRLVKAYKGDGNGVGVRACEDDLIAEVESIKGQPRLQPSPQPVSAEPQKGPERVLVHVSTTGQLGFAYRKTAYHQLRQPEHVEYTRSDIADALRERLEAMLEQWQLVANREGAVAELRAFVKDVRDALNGR